MWVLSLAIHASVLGASEQPCWATPSLAWLDTSQNCHDSEVFATLLSFLPILPSHKAIAPGGRSCLLPLPLLETLKTHSSSVSQHFLKDLNWHSVGFRAASLCTHGTAEKLPWWKHTHHYMLVQEKAPLLNTIFWFVLPKMYVYLYAFVSLFVSSLPYL